MDRTIVSTQHSAADGLAAFAGKVAAVRPLWFELCCHGLGAESGRCIASLQAFSFTTRVENALQSYGIYLWKTIWPFGFSLYYPFSQAAIPIWKPALATAVLVAISAIVWKQRIARPCLIMGWLWFLGTLVPVIGVVQVGDQAMADRYAYLPLIGIFVALVWMA